MKILKAKKKLKKSKIFKISNLTYVKHGLVLNELLKSNSLENPIEIKVDNHSSVMGAGGIKYHKKHYVVFRGSRRINTAIKLGYTHIEGVIVE